MPRPTLFLIDGSSQMYRAYHAFRGRGLSNQEGHTTHAVYVFVTMLRKLMSDHQPEYIAASFDLAGPTFRDDARRRLQGQPRRDARRPRRADQLGPRGLRGAGRPDPHRAGLRGRRRDRHGGEARRRRADSTSRSCRSTRTSSSSCTTGIRVYDPREDGAWFDEAAVRREVRRPAIPGRRRARARRRHERQRRRRAGHRQEGRHRPDHAVRQPRRAARQRRRADAAQVPRGAARASRRTRFGAASSSPSGPTCRSTSTSSRCATAAPSRERCYELFSRLAFRTLVNEYAPTADTIQKDYALVTTAGRARRARRRAARGGRVRPSRHPRSSRRPCAPAIVGIAFSTADRQARYVPLGHEGAGRRRPAVGTDDVRRRSTARRRSTGCSRCSRTSRSARSATT